MKVAYCFLIAVVVSGCTHLNSVSTTAIPKERSHKVKASSSRTIFLGFNFDNDYVDQVSLKLANQCPDGKVTGILTKHQITNYFLFFVWKSEVLAEGYCLNRKKRALLQGDSWDNAQFTSDEFSGVN